MWATEKQVGYIHVLCKKAGKPVPGDPSRLSKDDAGQLISQLLGAKTPSTSKGCYSPRAHRLERYLRGGEWYPRHDND